jgi:hypothetical protein
MATGILLIAVSILALLGMLPPEITHMLGNGIGN